MASNETKVIFYAYDSSPLWRKIQNVLLLRRIPYTVVTVSDKTPRPQLLQLGITYRRIPVMSIGNDVYFDTSLMIAELEHRFTPEKGHPSLLSLNAGLEQVTMQYYTDGVLFPLVAGFIPASRLSEDFKKDRKQYNPKLDFDANGAAQPLFLSQLRSHLMLIEQQISKSSTPFLLSTVEPTLLDVACFTQIDWAVRLRGAASVLVLPSSKAPLEYRRTMAWFEAMKARLDAAAGDKSNPATRPQKLDGDKTMNITLSSPATRSISGRPLKVDYSEPLVQAKWVVEGDLVSVTPTDTGKIPQYGRLVGLTAEIVSIAIQPEGSQQSFVGHFPRLGYHVKRESESKSPSAKL